MYQIGLLTNLLLLSQVLCRGPHHPRGETVVRHHVHYKPTKGREQNIIQDAELIHDKEHIQEHLEEIIEQPNLDNLTDDELDFYYFQVHDADKNSLLDGLEILQAIQHTSHHEDEEHDDEDEDETQENDIEYYTSSKQLKNINFVKYKFEFLDLIDRVFTEDDIDNDGFLSYPEYKAGRDKETVKLKALDTQMI